MICGFYNECVCANAVPTGKLDLRSGENVGVVVVPSTVAADVHGGAGIFLQADLAGLRIDGLYLQRGGVDAVGMDGAGGDIRAIDGGLARRAESRDSHIAGEVDFVRHQLDGPVGHGEIRGRCAGLHQPVDFVCRLRDRGDVALHRLDAGFEAVHGLRQGRNGAFRIFDSRIKAADRLGQRGYRPFCVFDTGIKTTHSLRERGEIPVHSLNAGKQLAVRSLELLPHPI